MSPTIRTGGVTLQEVGIGSGLTGTNMNIRVTQINHSLSVGNVIRHTGAIWSKAQANSLDASQSTAVVTEVLDSNNFIAVISGLTDKLSGLVPGKLYYLSNAIAGQATYIRPTTIGQYLKPVYYSVSSTQAIILDQQSVLIGSGTGYSPEAFPDHISPVGSLQPFSGPEDTIPANWVLCDGSALSKTDNSSEYLTLYNTISNAYYLEGTLTNRSGTSTGFPANITLTGGNHDIEVNDTLKLTFSSGTVDNAVVSSVVAGVISLSGISGGSASVLPAEDSTIKVNFGTSADKFFVPDLRGRTLIGSGQGNSLTNRVLGTIGGEEEHQLTTSEIPSHSHTIATGLSVQRTNAGTGFFVGSTTGSSSTVGGDSAHNNMQPYLVSNWIMRAKPISETAFIGPTGAQGATGATGGAVVLNEGIEISGFTRAVGLS